MVTNDRLFIVNKKANPLHPVPVMRFLVELTTWIWLLVAGLGFATGSERQVLPAWVFLLLLVISMFLLSQLNFPGDKKTHGKMVRDEIRILVEISSSLLGIFGAWILFGLLGFVSQLILTLISFYLDRDRWKWFLGRNKILPDYVLALGHQNST